MSKEYRWYKHRTTKKIHSRKESWFNMAEKEKLYEENFIRIKGEDDLRAYVKPKPKPKPKAKKKAKKKIEKSK